MKEIQLTNGKVALVDDEDYEHLNSVRWCAKPSSTKGRYYAYNGKFGYMARHLLNTPDDMLADHKDCNTLNNQRNNVRNCTLNQNLQNQVRKGEGYKGVNRVRGGKHQARISVNGVRISLGYFKDEITAAKTYNIAASLYFGEFANLNQIP